MRSRIIHARFLQVSIATLLLSGMVYAQEPDPVPYSERMARSVMQRNPGKYGNWDYVTGTVLRAFQELWLVTGEKAYFDYIRQTVDAVVDEYGHISDYRLSDYNIDEIKEGGALLFLYRHTGEERYRISAERLREQMATHPRTSEGGFWHKNRYPHQIWLDGLYMASPFLAEYAMMFDQPQLFDDVINQIVLADRYMYDPETGLYYHGWDESRTQEWADPVTGQSPSFWGRAVGWYAMAIIDVLDFLPIDHPGREQVMEILQRLVTGIISFQDETTGVWWQVLDYPGREGNYLESSVSSMFTYAMAKARRHGYLEDQDSIHFQRAYEGILEQFVTENPDGTLDLNYTCYTAGLGYGRDGSYEYYVYTATHQQNDGKGLGPFILASLEMENALFPPSWFKADSVDSDQIMLSWRDNSAVESGYILERYHDSLRESSVILPADQQDFTDQGLLPLTRYHYHLKAFHATDTTLPVITAFITTLGQNGEPAPATNPRPRPGAEGEPLKVLLEWKAGSAASSHNLYFGKSNPPPFLVNLDTASYRVADLEYSSTYYWRVDEINDHGTTEGDLWNFTTSRGPQLVGAWSFEEESGNLVEDHSSFGNQGQLIGMEDGNRVEGVSGKSLYFDGISQYVMVPHDPVFDFDTGSFSISLWMKQDPEALDMTKEYRYLIKGSHQENENEGNTGKRYEVFLNPASSQFRFAIDDHSTKSVARAAMSDFVTGNWVHVVAVRDRGEKIIRVYADTVLKSSAADQTGSISQKEALFFGYCKDFGSHFHGSLDEVRLFNYTLSQEEIGQLYKEAVASGRDPDPQMSGSVKLYPVPVTDRIRMDFHAMPEGELQVVIRTVLGQEVYRVRQLHHHYHTLELDVSRLPAGLYVVNIHTSAGTSTHKVIKQ